MWKLTQRQKEIHMQVNMMFFLMQRWSKTFRALMNTETRLYVESIEFIEELFRREELGVWDRFLEQEM